VGDDPRPVHLYVLLGAFTLPLALVTLAASIPMVLALFFWGMFTAVGFITVSLHVAARAYPGDQTGLVAGIGSGAWGAALAAMLPVLGRWFDLRWYGAAFAAMTAVPLIGLTFWLLLIPAAREREAGVALQAEAESGDD
jgi:hypothetical protein